MSVLYLEKLCDKDRMRKEKKEKERGKKKCLRHSLDRKNGKLSKTERKEGKRKLSKESLLWGLRQDGWGNCH